MTRIRLDIDARREHLLGVGRAAFAARPYDAVSIEEIAEEAGVSKGLLYHYFAGKRGFYVATLESAAAGLLVAIEARAEASGETPVDAALSGFFGYIREHAALYRALVGGGIGSDAEVAAIVERARAAAGAAVLRAAGLDAVDPIALRGWLGFVEGAGLAWLDHGGDPPVGLCRRALRAAVEGG